MYLLASSQQPVDILRRGVNARGQTWIDLFWGQAWLRLGRGERLRLPPVSRNRRNTPGPRRRAIEDIREARCDLPPQATKPAWLTRIGIVWDRAATSWTPDSLADSRS